MSKEFFRFKQFSVAHNQCAMKVGADAVLLGAWANCSHCCTALDVGTGSGVIALMLAQRTPETAQIYGLEIDHAAYLQACHNARQSPWPNRISMLHGDFLHFSEIQQSVNVPVSFDLIVSNPPYFQNHLLPPDVKRAGARHSTTLTHRQLLIGAAKLLNPGGVFCAIIPASEFAGFVQIAQTAAGLFCQQVVAVKTLLQKPVSRYLVQMGATQQGCTTTELITGGAHPTQFTPQCRELTAPFYLHL
ncbi:hypothetical protein C7N43_37125 [Sphingobacteriales bacterium UPWRP_1]|nr:hypothetical protein C7N43_37125 [Sphingobacteriales bacterium UPWRP_1]